MVGYLLAVLGMADDYFGEEAALLDDTKSFPQGSVLLA
jgi:hypothetical protein